MPSWTGHLIIEVFDEVGPGVNGCGLHSRRPHPSNCPDAVGEGREPGDAGVQEKGDGERV